MSKFVAILITYPLTTIRTRIQQNQYFNNRSKAKYSNALDASYRLIRDEGVSGFYKGLIPNLMKGIPQRGIYFYFYELFKNIMVGPPKETSWLLLYLLFLFMHLFISNIIMNGTTPRTTTQKNPNRTYWNQLPGTQCHMQIVSQWCNSNKSILVKKSLGSAHGDGCGYFVLLCLRLFGHHLLELEPGVRDRPTEELQYLNWNILSKGSGNKFYHMCISHYSITLHLK